MPRYVILHHEMPPASGRQTHWDLMLEWGGALRTWAIPREPIAELDSEAEQLADHRAAYLDYEGPVSNDRGSVTRWDEGHYELERNEPDKLTLVLEGRRLRGTLSLHRDSPEGHSWRVVLSAAPTRG